MKRSTATIMLLLISITLSSCGQRGVSTDGFIEYNSNEFITENSTLADRIPVFTVNYPPDWGHHWVGDSGVIALLIASGDLQAAWREQDYTGARMLIIPAPYSGQELTEFFYSTLDARTKLDGKKTEINGQQAAIAEYTRRENSYIEVVIVKGDRALLVVADFPIERESEFRSIVEATINTIEMEAKK